MYYAGILAAFGTNVDINDLKHIQDLLDAEEQGLLLKLPCKVGDEVWRVYMQHDHYDDTPYEIVTSTLFRLDMLDCIGKTVFLTKKEAEKALAEMEK